MIFAFSFVISIISIIIIKQLLNQFITEREKPIDLFLSIKKNKFEELKVSSEAFLNKLLNQIYGNEETEEDMLDESAIAINQSDFNIQKFTKQIHKKSYKSNTDYLVLLLRIFGFFIFFQAYMAFKFTYYQYSMKNVSYFSDIYNSTQFMQTDVVLTVDVHKQYFYDINMPMLSSFETKSIFDKRVLNIGNTFEEMIKVIKLIKLNI